MNSSLVSYTNLSPNKNSPRNHAIERITPHCVVGQLSAESICGCFNSKSREASCNYAIGCDGKIALCVDENDRSWCSSSPNNDNRAVTIECASDKSDPYAMNDEVYDSLVNLCVDICRRNGKTTLLWFDDKQKTFEYVPKSNEMVLSVHRWFANKSCPGDWLYSRLGNLASMVTERLGGTNENISSPQEKIYRVRKSWNDSKSQIGAFVMYNLAKDLADKNNGYCVFDAEGNQCYPDSTSESFEPYQVKVTTDALNIRKGAGTNYDKTGVIRDRGVYTIVEESSGAGATVWGKLKSGAGWIALYYTERI